METEKMKMKAGKLYDANYDKELLAERAACADLTYELNQLRPSKAEERDTPLQSGRTGCVGKAHIG